MQSKYNQEMILRKQKLERLRSINKAIFPNNFNRNSNSAKILNLYNKFSKEKLQILQVKVKVAGRMMIRRIIGKASFFRLQDHHGSIQVYVRNENLLGFFNYKEFKKLDLGDILGVEGTLFKTNTKELSINATKITLLTKSVRPLPEKFRGLVNKEKCYRKRYLDLIVNSKSRQKFLVRSKIIREIRNFMYKKKFIEVETPMMHLIPGGASARPFITHHNTLNLDFYLRIAPELYLKKLIVGGFEKIFEINRSFRNEGISPFHNPEFTMMELYVAYVNYNYLIKFTEDLFIYLMKKILNSDSLLYGKHSLKFKHPFNIMTLEQAINKYININASDLNNLLSIKQIAESLHINIDETWSVGKIQLEIFDKRIKKNIIQPTFITLYPKDISPLARSMSDNDLLTERFEIFICGMEIGNGFSELNDPEDQLNRFKYQALIKENIENSNILYDKDYITALEHGLPPTSGLGIGIDRLVMLMTNSASINDVILFPTLRPK